MVETLPAATHGDGTPQALMPAVSIIVPVYNVGEALLRACIESALAQTLRDFELILVDDASTDNSAAICESYASDSRVRLLLLPYNRGVSYARNQGVAISSGTYITFLDADDRLAPEALEHMLRASTESGADIVVANFEKVGILRKASDMCQSGRSTERPYVLSGLVFDAHQATADCLYQHTLNCSPWGKLYRRKICKIIPFPPCRYEDLLALPQMFLKANKVAFLPEPLYLYTENPGSYLHTFNLGRAVVLDVTEELVELMPTPELKRAARDRALSAAFNIFNLMTVHKVNAPEIEGRCKATIRRYRRESLLNPHVRLKNKLGILLTYLGGFQSLRLAAKFFQKP